MKKYIFILDVDGVLTTGHFIYSENGKILKVFGAHDNDGLKLLRNELDIRFITADKRGYSITKKRVSEDMGFELELVTENDRYKYLDNKYGLKNIIYMGDGIHDAPIIKDCIYGIAPKSARVEAKKVADFVTSSNAGEGAVLDACLKIKNIFLEEI